MKPARSFVISFLSEEGTSGKLSGRCAETGPRFDRLPAPTGFTWILCLGAPSARAER